MGTVLIIFAFIFVLGPIAKAYADRMSRDAAGPGVRPQELTRLREEVDRLSTEVSRLHEEQSFMLKLLGDADRKKLIEGRNSPE